MKHQLGSSCSDIVTGFKGIITGRVEYLTGCAQYLVQPKTDEKGDFKDARWFDENRVDVLSGIPVVQLAVSDTEAKQNGPDVSAPIK